MTGQTQHMLHRRSTDNYKEIDNKKTNHHISINDSSRSILIPVPRKTVISRTLVEHKCPTQCESPCQIKDLNPWDNNILLPNKFKQSPNVNLKDLFRLLVVSLSDLS
jgi:hypothetical protein